MRFSRISIGTLVTAFAVASIFSAIPAFAGVSGPEIDPGAATGGLALLAATILIVVERYRRR
jgi:hypothetical protein